MRCAHCGPADQRARRVIVFRGLPGCGKSTLARRIHAAEGGWIAERDLLRLAVSPGGWPHGRKRDEDALTYLQVTAAEMAYVAGESLVIVPDTNLVDAHVTPWAMFAGQWGADLVVIDMRSVPLEVCIARDAPRQGTPGYLGAELITAQWREHIEPLGLTPAPADLSAHGPDAQ
jgi:predicted kinase